MLHKSIRFRIQFWHSLLLAATTVGLSVSYFYYEKQSRIREIDTSLHRESLRQLPLADRYIADRFPDQFVRPSGNREDPGGGRPPPRRRPANGPPRSLSEREELINQNAIQADTSVYAWDHNSQAIFQTRNAPIDYPPLPDWQGAEQKPRFATIENVRIFINVTRGGHIIGFAKDIGFLDAELLQLKINLLGLDLLILIFGISVGWYLTGRAIRPIHRINDAARLIADGQRKHRIDSSYTRCELGELANILNETFDKLDHSFDQQVKFTADASHELRTPVAAILTQIQLALSRDRDTEEYKSHLLACQNKALHMRDLLNSLLDLARTDSGELEFKVASYDLAELIMECLEWLEPLVQEKQLTFETDLNPVTAEIDGLRIGQVITNIISNAIRYSPHSGRISISLTSNDDTAFIEIADEGPGIPEEALPHVFERFYRVSKSRSSTQNSVGLGLSIAKAIVEQHKGKITAKRGDPGTVFTILLPLSN